MRGSIAGAILSLALAAPQNAAAQVATHYPTATLAEYVLGCMRSNGQTRDISLADCHRAPLLIPPPYLCHVADKSFATW